MQIRWGEEGVHFTEKIDKRWVLRFGIFICPSQFKKNQIIIETPSDMFKDVSLLALKNFARANKNAQPRNSQNGLKMTKIAMCQAFSQNFQ